MAANNAEREREARRVRAERIRQERDARQARRSGAPLAEGAQGEPATAEAGGEASDRDQNYVDLIEQRMRELDRPRT